MVDRLGHRAYCCSYQPRDCLLGLPYVCVSACCLQFQNQAVSFEGRELSFVQHLALPGCGPSLGNQVLCNRNYNNKKRRTELEECFNITGHIQPCAQLTSPLISLKLQHLLASLTCTFVAQGDREH